MFSGYLSFAGSCDGAQSTAERSYPTSKVRGRSWENPMPEGQQPRGVTLRLRSGAVAKSARLRWRRNGQEELLTARGQGAVAETSNPTSKERWLHGHRRTKRSYSMFKVRRGGGKEIPLIQGKEQWLHFAGAAVKRYPTPKVRETQVRW